MRVGRFDNLELQSDASKSIVRAPIEIASVGISPHGFKLVLLTDNLLCACEPNISLSGCKYP